MQYNNRSFWASIGPVTRHLLLINIVLWLATLVLQRTSGIDLVGMFGLHFWKGSEFKIWQFFTYMFLHDPNGISHILFNMFMLWMFGTLIERVLGSKRYLFFYISCGLGAALLQELIFQFTWQNTLMSLVNAPAGTVVDDVIKAANSGLTNFTMDDFFNGHLGGLPVSIGASGALFGILLAVAMFFPNLPLLIFFIPIPIKAKWVVIGMAVLSLYFGLSGIQPNIGHYAHLGGMIAGFFIIMYWKYDGTIRKINGFY